MKKDILYWSIIALTLCFFSCSKEEQDGQEQVPQKSGKIAVQLGAVSESSSDIKTSITAGMTVEWLDSDQIAVFDGTSKNTFSIKTNSGTSAVFTGIVDEEATSLYAAYPASLATQLSGETITTAIPTEQVVPTGKNVGNGALVAVAKENSGSLAFKNAVSLFKFTINDSDITSVSINAIGGEALSGTVEVTVSATPSCSVVSGISTVTVLPENGTFAPGTYYAAVIPGTFSKGLAVILTHSGDSKGGMKQSSASASVVRNDGKDLGTLKSSDMIWGTYIRNLAELRSWSTEGDFTVPAILGADIEVGEWSSYYRGSAFNSTFYGLGHKLYNITCNPVSGPCAFLCQPLNVENLIIGSRDGKNYDGTSCFTLGTSTNSYCCLFVYSKAGGTINQVTNFAKYEATTAHTGTGAVRVGAIIGASNGGTISNCKNYGEVVCSAQTTGAETMVGGLIAFVDAGVTTISNCANYGNVTSYCPRTCYMGGISSRTQNNTDYQRTIDSCHNFGKISAYAAYSGELFVGGIIGKAFTTTIKSCINEGEVAIGTEDGALSITTCGAGGILGYSEDGTKFWGNTNKGTVFAHANASNLVAAGGLIASSYYVTSGKYNDNQGNVRAKNAHTSGPAAAGGCYGAEFKSTHSGIITNPWLERFSNSGNVSSVATSNLAYAGGIGGYLVGMRFWMTYNTGAVSGYDATISGSFAGRCDATYAYPGCAGSVNGTALTSENWSSYKMGGSSTGTYNTNAGSFTKPSGWGEWDGNVK